MKFRQDQTGRFSGDSFRGRGEITFGQRKGGVNMPLIIDRANQQKKCKLPNKKKGGIGWVGISSPTSSE